MLKFMKYDQVVYKYPEFVITGAVRSGSTFLVALISNLGIHTGFSPKTVRGTMGSNTGGLEYLRSKYTRKFARRGDYPPVVKQPYALTRHGEEQILITAKRERWPIRHIFITQRNLESNVQSQVDYNIRRGITLEAKREAEFERLSLETQLVTVQIEKDKLHYPHTYMEFPRLVQDVYYCYICLRPMLDVLWDGSFEEFKATFYGLADVDLVHFQ